MATTVPVAGRKAYHIVPSKTVAATIKKSHGDWLKSPGRKGQAHKNTSMRKFTDKDDEYLERWDLLGL